MTMRERNDAREEILALEQRRPATDRDREAAQPASGTSLLQHRHRLPRLKHATIIILLIAILVVSSALVALITYWIGY